MKNLFFILCILLGSLCQATTWYVSESGGSDSYDGKSSSTPFKTLAKMNSTTVATGDYILLKAGDTFSGYLQVSVSGLHIGSYGTGAKPIISALQTVSGWTADGGGIYYTSLSSLPRLVLLNGLITEKGRYPRSGWNTYEGAGAGYITDKDLAAPTTLDWTGASVTFKPAAWQYYTYPIASHTYVDAATGSKLTLSGTTTKGTAAYGYFIVDDKRVLNPAIQSGIQVGDWAYDATGGRLYMYFGASAPSSYTVQVTQASQNNAMTLSNASNTTVSNLVLQGGHNNGVGLSGTFSDNNTFDNCEFRLANRGANLSDGQDGNTFTNCYFHGLMTTAIETTIGTTNITVSNSTIDSIGMWETLMPDGNTPGTGLNLIGDGVTITGNTIQHVGQSGILFRKSNVLIEHNVISNFTMRKMDAGGIYCKSYPNQDAGAAFTQSITIPTTPTTITLNGLTSVQNVSDPATVFYAGANAMIYKADQGYIYITGTIQSYDKASGTLVIATNGYNNTGTYSNWVVTNTDLPKNRIVRNNIVTTSGQPLGNGTGMLSHGIYLDDNSYNLLIEHNTISTTLGYGLFIHDSRSVEARYNIFYNTPKSGLRYEYNIAATTDIRNTNVHDNVFVMGPTSTDQPISAKTASPNVNDIKLFGVSANNYFRSTRTGTVSGAGASYNIDPVGYSTNAVGNTYLSFADWQANWGFETGSRHEVHDGTETRLEYNTNNSVKTVLFAGKSYRDLSSGTVYRDSLQLNAYEGKALLADTSSNLPPVVDAGPNTSITLPDTVVVLHPTATDPDGDPMTYSWSMVSGNTTVIASNNTLSTEVHFYMAGTYVFQLAVSDDHGHTTTDTVTVIVYDNTGGSGSGHLKGKGKLKFNTPPN